ncbi:hypothetical protein V8E53_012654 [Lactarius tabidus]
MHAKLVVLARLRAVFVLVLFLLALCLVTPDSGALHDVVNISALDSQAILHWTITTWDPIWESGRAYNNQSRLYCMQRQGPVPEITRYLVRVRTKWPLSVPKVVSRDVSRCFRD